MAQAGVVSPFSHHLHDSSLAGALGMKTVTASVSREASPWSKFLSPSLFALDPSGGGQRSSPLPAVVPPTPSPLKQQHNHPSMFSHSREINPFEQSFSHPPAVEAVQGGVEQAGGADFTLQAGSMFKRKRAMSSPALFTPGGTGENIGESVKEAFLHQNKRPSLRLGAAGIPAHMAVPFAPTPDSTLSFRSSVNNSFDETTASGTFYRHRRGASLNATISPDSSLAPSPHSPKLGAGGSPFDRSVPTFAHFQPAPAPFTMPLPPVGSAPYADSSTLAMTTIAPGLVASEAAASLPFVPQPPPVATFIPISGPAHLSTDPSFAPPADPYAIRPFDPAAPAAYPLAVDPSGFVAAASPVVGQAPYPVFPPIPTTSFAPSVAPTTVPPPPAPPVIPVIPLAPLPSTSASAIPVSKKPAAPKAKAASKAAPVAAQVGLDGEPLPKPKPPGKKRGRKPKNWDPTLEKAIELEPEEQEKQRKLALERNRIAASKSRRRKKERVELLETASTDLCNKNLALQAECRALLAEVHSLRTFISQSHPLGCACVHIQGYLAREREGGGIPAILYGAGASLERDYSQVPKYGSDDDLFAGQVENAALEALTIGGGLGSVPGLEGVRAAPVKAKKNAGAAAGGSQSPVLGASASDIPVKGGRAVSMGAEDDSDGEDEHDASQSEEEQLELKSRRARVIPVRKQDV
ncbi:hypothetical protein JCM8547_000188 [Rhodosporidiobolus lusitaniae]